MSEPPASLIVSTWNGRHLLETCLPRLLEAVAYAGGDHEIIVVDDASHDDTVEFVRREFPQVRLVALRRNLRFAGANNAGARAARGEVLVFLNNDVIPDRDFLPPLLRHFADPSVFAATAHIRTPEADRPGGRSRETGLVRPRFEDGFFALRHEEPVSREPVPVIYAGGGSSAYRRSAFLRLGGFDRLFRPFYFEDLDVTYRAQKAGLRVLFEPRSRVLHKHRQTNSPRNFPGGYVDRMFEKNQLLFTWKVLTDREYLSAHFRSLWRRLMRPRDHPHLVASFLRAARQLPELLIKRHRARPHMLRRDRDIVTRAAPLPQELAADAGAAPLGSLGTGRRVLVLGCAPLPFEGEQRLSAGCARTWQIAAALLADDHRVTIVGWRVEGGYERERDRPAALRFRGQHCDYYSLVQELFARGELLAQIAASARPEVIVAVGALAAAAAARLETEAPLWADLSDAALAEAQARAAREGDDAAVAQALEWQWAALARADVLSGPTLRRKWELVGELAARGRLRAEGFGRDVVKCLPLAIEGGRRERRPRVLRGRTASDEDVIVLWAGQYDASVDADTLFAGVTEAMRREPRLRFVSLGGATSPGARAALHDLERRARESGLGERFTFLGWTSHHTTQDCYAESDIGVSVDLPSYQSLLGVRYRVLDMLRARLPVIVTEGSELAHAVSEQRLGLTFAPGDAQGLRDAILTLAADVSLRRRCGARGREYVTVHHLAEEVLAPLRAWVREPSPGPDRLPLEGIAPPSARSALGRCAEAWEAKGPWAGARCVLAGLGAAAACLAVKAFVRRRATARWGIDPREPVERALIIRAGTAELTWEVAERIRRHYPSAEVVALAPSSAAGQTGAGADLEVIAAREAGGMGCRLGLALVRRLRARGFDTAVVAGEGSQRAELIALLATGMRRVEVREDGAAHVFWLAPYKPLLVLFSALLGAVERLTLSALVAAVYGSLRAEGLVWSLRRCAASARGALLPRRR